MLDFQLEGSLMALNCFPQRKLKSYSIRRMFQMGDQISTIERRKMIRELQELAAQVLELKNTHRQKRPIVIEFSGSPKAGKTSCINSLELFLKRNDFSVEIIHERAGICRVANKHSPMFNIWTSCTSIAGMVDVLERKDIDCDVLILDRGIFDACCWFNWLTEKKFMEKGQRNIVETFLTMDDFVNRIDIVFAFYVRPEISIEREYANLLTDKQGSIMNQNVLSEYFEQIKKTVAEKRNRFHKIFEIDTSARNQDEVGKEVTERTLNTLKELLMERIGYFDIEFGLKNLLNQKRVFAFDELSDSLNNIQLGLRCDVEDNNYIQPIPIIVITNREHDKILAIKKNSRAVSKRSPEKDKLLLYIGGHSRSEDHREIQSNKFLDLYRETLRREVREELGISIQIDEIIPFFIYTPENEKSKKHLGGCFVVEMDIDTLKLRLDQQELILSKGTSKSGKFQNITDFMTEEKKLEAWSTEILRYFFKKGTMSLF